MQQRYFTPLLQSTSTNSSKGNIQAFFQAAVTIRQNNMALAGSNPNTLRSLVLLEEQQVKDIALLNQLTGDANGDLKVLAVLKDKLVDAIGDNRGLQSTSEVGP